MSKKVQKRVNGGLAIYYGMGAGALSVASLVALIVWIVKVFLGKTEFSWGAVILLPIVIFGFGFMAYALLRVGYEELED
ncbi:MAG TPA: hypothetical protein DHV26_07595 [Cytophagales bacterium]|nr:hypothetical protein [Cytophagales bacterium]HRG07324.1 hypothetical protein [Cyclobacteriaceae bacterium]